MSDSYLIIKPRFYTEEEINQAPDCLEFWEHHSHCLKIFNDKSGRKHFYVKNDEQKWVKEGTDV